MSSNQLELLRANHELSQLCEAAICSELDAKPNGQNAKVTQQHRLKQLIDKIVNLNRVLDATYVDEDSGLADEVASLQTATLDAYYDRLNATKEFYQNYPRLVADDNPKIDFLLNVQFSGEEVFGKYLDLNEQYVRFSDICRKHNLDFDYVQYLERFDSFFYLPKNLRASKQYLEYLDNLWGYLCSFFRRVFPLLSLDEMVKEFYQEYRGKLRSGALSDDLHVNCGATADGKLRSSAPQALRLGMFNDPSELEALGLDRLKEALEAIGLKCGGTLNDRATRLWSVRGKKPTDFPPQLLAKQTKRKRSVEDTGDDEGSNDHDILWKEYRVSSLSNSMADIVGATRKHAEKQQARTLEEKEAELLEEEHGLLPTVGDADAQEEEDEEPIYNPLNLPLGWDGKPIPFWMYKLHGLGVEYKCEICGNQSYWGRRAFDKHFQEWKHAHGMRALGIPNTKHFHDITLIEDAVNLYAKIKGSAQLESVDSFLGLGQSAGSSSNSSGGMTVDVEGEEFEDTEGNVLDRRTYEDLARQGLL